MVSQTQYLHVLSSWDDHPPFSFLRSNKKWSECGIYFPNYTRGTFTKPPSGLLMTVSANAPKWNPMDREWFYLFSQRDAFSFFQGPGEHDQIKFVFSVFVNVHSFLRYRWERLTFRRTSDNSFATFGNKLKEISWNKYLWRLLCCCYELFINKKTLLWNFLYILQRLIKVTQARVLFTYL